MSVKILAEHDLEFLSLKGGCTGSSKSTLVKMPHCWKSHVTTQLLSFFILVHDSVCVAEVCPHLNFRNIYPNKFFPMNFHGAKSQSIVIDTY